MSNESSPKRILIVDDEPEVLFVLKMALEKSGYIIEEAHDGEMALEKVGEKPPDAIVLDFMMPKLDGHSVNIKLKENPATAQIPVVIITGKGHLKELLVIREEFRVSAYLEKPFRVQTLIEKLGIILQ